MKRRWFTPEKGKRFIENGIRSGFLAPNGKYLAPSFPYSDIDIPFGYYPPESLAEYSGDDIMARIKSEWGLSEEDLRSALSTDYNLEDEVKILLWGARNGKEYSGAISDVESYLMEEYKKN